MAEPSEFISGILQLMTPLGDVRSKRMFGGHGLFLDGKMFALVSRGEELFLKADDVNKDDFIERGRKTHGKMPYYAVPDDAMSGWKAMKPWADGAVAASQRAKSKK